MKIVVLSTDREQYLLQWWLPHSANKFDFGVIVDFNPKRDDGTYELYQKHVPHWRYLNVKKQEVGTFLWDVILNKIENDIQKEYPDSWVTTLNATEFLIGNLSFLDGIKDKKQVLLPCHLMNDAVAEEYVDPDPDVPLLKQRTHGVHYSNDLPHPHKGKSIQLFNAQQPVGVVLNTRWMRSIHNFPIDYLGTSYYGVGRHYWNTSNMTTLAAICHMNMSPYTNSFIQRKLGVQERLTDNDKKMDRGFHHYVNRELVERRKRFYDQLTVDLKPEIERLESR